MLTGLTKSMRSWLAMGFIAFYAACIIVPTVALAFSESPCSMEHDQGLLRAHAHGGDDAQHKHMGTSDDQDDQQGSASACCGLAFFSAIAPEVDLALAAPVQTGRTSFAIKQNFSGLPPDKLIRPPRSQS